MYFKCSQFLSTLIRDIDSQNNTLFIIINGANVRHDLLSLQIEKKKRQERKGTNKKLNKLKQL